MDNKTLVKLALEARKTAYAPYSNYLVGAALLASDGTVYTGCNIECITFSPTVCAERTAFFKAISEGCYDFEKIAVVGGVRGFDDVLATSAFPCGVCRQVMLEFCNPEEFKVIVGKSEDDFEEYTLADLAPHSFSPKNQKLG